LSIQGDLDVPFFVHSFKVEDGSVDWDVLDKKRQKWKGAIRNLVLVIETNEGTRVSVCKRHSLFSI